VLIVDFSMPGMSGIQLLERARAKRPEIRAVFITGYVGHTWLNGNLADEIVVKKPFTMGPASARRAQGVGRIRHLGGSAITHKERRLQSSERFLPPLASRVSPLALTKSVVPVRFFQAPGKTSHQSLPRPFTAQFITGFFGGTIVAQP
jgi:uncharacterized protein YjbJ (UPF0337 family)/CheY-like chemotaxis protein